MVDTQEFWAEVREERMKLSASLERGEFEGQPGWQHRLSIRDAKGRHIDNNIVYIVSVRNRDRGTFPDAVVLTTAQIAGQRLTEQTHRVATAEEISAHLEAQAAVKEAIDRAEIMKKTTYQVDAGRALADTRRALADKV